MFISEVPSSTTEAAAAILIWGIINSFLEE